MEGGGMVRFAYRGALEPEPAAPGFSCVDLSAAANMGLANEPGTPPEVRWMEGDEGNDLAALPVGSQVFCGIPFQITDPAQNQGRAVIAVRRGMRQEVRLPINAVAGSFYLLHTAAGIKASGVAGAVVVEYDDDTSHSVYILNNNHLVSWWFPRLAKEHSGVAWRGANKRSTDVGICWAALTHPFPEKKIRNLVFTASIEGSTYVVAGLTLCDQKPASPVGLVSHGGPDNWAGGTCMAALLEGLAGIHDTQTGFRVATLSPRWSATALSGEVRVVARYGSGDGYIAYTFLQRDSSSLRGEGGFELLVAGSGERVRLRVLLPSLSLAVASVRVNEINVTWELERVEDSQYVCLWAELPGPARISINYQPVP
jgi:hypothetical protein